MEFIDLKGQYETLKPQMDQAIAAALTEARFISGPQVQRLERALADFVGVRHCVTCANGTDALSLALMAWGVGPGDAVFVPDFTFFATAEVVSHCGATPVFVDVREDTFNLDPTSLEEAVTRVEHDGKLIPRAVIPVDLFGQPADYPAICRVARKYGLKVLEDGAQGFGGRLDGKRACSFGEIATTSFFPAKPLGCYGDGGALFTNDEETAALLRSLCVHGKGSFKYDNVRIGRNSRLDTLQAAILQVKLEAFQSHELQDRERWANAYTQRLSALVSTPVVPEGYVSSWAQYTIRLTTKEQRDRLQAGLKGRGIPSMVYYPKPLHLQTVYQDCNLYGMSLERAVRLCDTVLSLPMHPYLTEQAVEQVCTAVRECL